MSMNPAVSMLLPLHLHCCMTSLAMRTDVCSPTHFRFPNNSRFFFFIRTWLPQFSLVPPSLPFLLPSLFSGMSIRIRVCLHSNYELLLMCTCYLSVIMTTESHPGVSTSVIHPSGHCPDLALITQPLTSDSINYCHRIVTIFHVLG